MSDLENARVPDAVLAKAYDDTPDTVRAWLKTTQALVLSVHGERPVRRQCRTWPAGTGFAHEVCTESVPWAGVVVGPGFGAACRLSAALMVARVAGVEALFVIFSGDIVASALLVACELAGVQDIFMAEPDAVHAYLQQRAQNEPGGRLLFFAGADAADGCEPDSPSFRAAVEIWKSRAPRAALLPDCHADIAAFHPDAKAVSPDDAPDVLYGECPEGAPQYAAALHLGPGLEGAWLHVDLAPEFFARTRYHLTRTELEESL